MCVHTFAHTFPTTCHRSADGGWVALNDTGHDCTVHAANSIKTPFVCDTAQLHICIESFINIEIDNN